MFNGCVTKIRHGGQCEKMEFAIVAADRCKLYMVAKGYLQQPSADIVFVGESLKILSEIDEETYHIDERVLKAGNKLNTAIFGVDFHGRIFEWNDKLVSLSGFTREEMVGKSLIQVLIFYAYMERIHFLIDDGMQDVISREHTAAIKQILDQVLSGMECDSLEFPIITSDLRRIDLLFATTARRDARGKITGMIAIGLDITERKQMEVEKTRVAQELQTFIDTTNAPIFGIDSHGLVNEWNEKCVSITGFTRSEVLGRNLVQDFITQEYQFSVQGVIDDALQGREAANFEFPFYTKDNRRVEVLLNATTRRDFGGNVVGVLCIGQDITERKQVEVEKTRVAQELQTFIDTANAPIFGIDADGLVNEWNNKSAAITGFAREEVLGKNLVQVFITQEYQVSVKEVLDNALHGRETANFEFPLYTKDQRRVDVLLNATTRRDVSGNVVGVLGVGQDITERKQIEVEKTRVAQELQTFIDTANAPIFGIDADGLVNEWNNKSAAITGFSREEVLGRNLVQVHIACEHGLP
jgi:PAS domain S-box-containing protein